MERNTIGMECIRAPHAKGTEMDVARTYTRFVHYLDDSLNILEMSIQSVASAESLVRAAEAKLKLEDGDLPGLVWTPETIEEQEQLIERLRERAEFARKERDHGYPILHGQATVGLWAALEALIEDLTVGLLMEWPDRLDDARFQKVRVSLSQFVQMDEADRSRFLLAEAAKTPITAPASAIARLEALLELIGLPPFGERDRKRDLVEMHGVRNLILHRASVVDQKFNEGCPWLGLSLGEVIHISHDDILRYVNAVVAFVAHVRDSVKSERLARKQVSQSSDQAEDSKEP
jgi:hypothetical protein